jgi:hypothetical protein
MIIKLKAMILKFVYCLVIGLLVSVVAAWLWCELVKKIEKQKFDFSIALKDITFSITDAPVNGRNKVIFKNDIANLRRMPRADKKKIDELEVNFKMKYLMV